MTCYRFIGEVYRAMNKISKAAEYNQRHLNLAKRLDDKLEIQRSYCNNGNLYLDHAEYLLNQQLFLEFEMNIDIAKAQLEKSKDCATALVLDY